MTIRPANKLDRGFARIELGVWSFNKEARETFERLDSKFSTNAWNSSGQAAHPGPW
jgi:coproporphyrinogen III oxidase-like Fe-S oxidoreductase